MVTKNHLICGSWFLYRALVSEAARLQSLTLTCDINNQQQSLSVCRSCCRPRSYPHIGHGGGRVEEFADDVGGGGDAEDDGAEDLLPPWQQQYGVLPPAAVTPCTVSFYQAYGTFTFLPVTLAVGEVVSVVYGEKSRNLSVGFSGF